MQTKDDLQYHIHVTIETLTLIEGESNYEGMNEMIQLFYANMSALPKNIRRRTLWAHCQYFEAGAIHNPHSNGAE